MAMGRCFLVQDASRHLQLEVVIENLLYSLTDAQWIKHLHVRHAIEKDNTRDEFVGMLDLIDLSFTRLLAKRLLAPMLKKPVMKPLLVHCRQFTAKAFVKILDYFRVASHIDHSYRYGEHWAGNLRVYSATAESIHQTPKMQEDNRSDTWARAMAQCPLGDRAQRCPLFCRAQAKRANNKADRESWLEMARRWEGMLRPHHDNGRGEGIRRDPFRPDEIQAGSCRARSSKKSILKALPCHLRRS